MRYAYLITAFVGVLIVSVFGFRGSTFTAPPIEVFPEWAFPGMRDQPKLRPQSESAFFADGRADRPIPANTVARGDFHADEALASGRDAAGNFVQGFPASLTIDDAFFARGQERYAIYCLPCHGAIGDGQGVTRAYGMNVPTYHDERRRGLAEGELYDIIVNGSQAGLMLPYADKLTVEDRWAVVAYVKVLQRAQLGTPADVTDADARRELGLP
jgi:mono/diheme cytochrome c family protein